MITIENISKAFGKVKVLDQLTLELFRGQSVALIGPNGSGKTTLIKCLLGLAIPDSGIIKIDGNDVKGEWQYRSRIGYMPQIGRYPDNITVMQLLQMIKEIRKGTYDVLDEELLESFHVKSFGNKTMRTLSGGTRQKVSACLAFMFDPEILILDEPTAGLDPVSAEILKEKVKTEQRKGKLVLITSHILSDLEDLTNEVAFINEGRLIFFKQVEAIKKETGSGNLSKAIARIMQEQNLITPIDNIL
ncbi:MAG: ABC transporter ATP-binding protein [Bacteroidetes bacterium]|nr:ABC transporter ATP-binding protein [Bacteroidota bacterium]